MLRRQLLLIHSCLVHVVTEIVAVLQVLAVLVLMAQAEQVLKVVLQAAVPVASAVATDQAVIFPDKERTER